jgi:hypothetical protein
MIIYDILASIPHNSHYLNRYFRFIKGCQKVNEDFDGYTEKHHICPRSLFPEYKSFGKHPWNCTALIARQHFIAHWILWKAYPDFRCMSKAFFLMTHSKNQKLDSRTYARLREEYSEIARESVRKSNKKRIENGTHNFLNGDIARKAAEKRIENGTFHLLGGELVRKRVTEGTHNFLGGDITRKTQNKRVKDGSHHFLNGKIQRESNKKRLFDGTHNLLGSVTCFDKSGKCVQIPKNVYHSQTGPKENWEFVHVKSKEAKDRKI